MRIGMSALALCAAVCLQTATIAAQSRPLTLAEVLSSARATAPQIVMARLALEEARARHLGASVRFQTNPELDFALGNRDATDRRSTDFQLGVGQTFEPGSRRSARLAGATAALAQGTADVDETTRRVLRAAAGAYYRGLHAAERIRLLSASRELAARVASVADRRFKAGDIAVLDVNIARASLARARAAIEAAEASRTLALGELGQLLGVDHRIEIEGSLANASGETDLTALLQASSDRPELRVLEAGVQEAEAERQLGQSFARPEYGVGARYGREEGDQIVMGALTITLPVFSKGQELTASGAARATRLRSELEAVRTRVRAEVRAAYDAYSRRLAAVRVLEADAIPGLDENEALAARSFDVGQLGLPELLLIRRELIDTRSDYLDALLEAALARIDLDASAAILR